MYIEIIFTIIAKDTYYSFKIVFKLWKGTKLLKKKAQKAKILSQVSTILIQIHFLSPDWLIKRIEIYLKYVNFD